MSTKAAAAEARVIDLSAARARGAGQRTVERLRDGRRKGDHGNRAAQVMRVAVVLNLRDRQSLRGDVTVADKALEARKAGVTERTVSRWWAAELDRQLKLAQQLNQQTPAAGDEPQNSVGPTATVNVAPLLPRYLYRFSQPDRLQLTPAEIAFFARHTTTKHAIDAVAADPSHRLSHYSRSTLYAAYANVCEPIRTGARKGAKAQRQIEATYPLTGHDAINETWTIDEYDLKLTASDNGVVVEPKLLLVREALSGVPVAYTVLRQAATGVDTGKVLAAAAIGYTVSHPDDNPDDPNCRNLRVSGVARLLVSDQGGSFLGEDGVAAARRLGIGLNPRPSHQPQANGDHEVMHQSLLRSFADGAGSRRGWTDRAGNRLSHGLVPFDVVVGQVNDWFETYLATEYTSGDRRGRTRLEVYADHVEAGQVFQGHELTPADEAALATPVATRSYDPTRGLLHNQRYWLGPELASAARPGDVIELRQLLDPDVLYAFTITGTFIGLLNPRADADLDDVYTLHADRAKRERFVRDRIAKPRAAEARGEAAAYWDEVAEALADAAEDVDAAAQHVLQEQDPEPDVELTQPTADSAPETHNVTATDVLDTVKPTSRRRRTRRPPPQSNTDRLDPDEQADAIASLFSRRANDSETDATDGDHDAS